MDVALICVTRSLRDFDFLVLVALADEHSASPVARPNAKY
jgi:hypothetical protein